MKISWVFAAGYSLDPTLDVEQLKSVGPGWGSWKTWRSCGTDNVICYDLAKCRDLVQRNFQQSCNLYIPAKHYSEIGRPAGVRLYEGDYRDQIDDLEDIVAMHFAVADSDIVLAAGFDFSTIVLPEDKLEQHKLRNKHGLIRTLIASKQETQWVAVDQRLKLVDPSYKSLENFTCDTMQSVLKLLV